MRVTKACQVLRRYKAGEKNFNELNLTGQSFKGKDLSGADFSKAILHSTNFSDSILRGVIFTNAKCGLQRQEKIKLILIIIVLGIISGSLTVFNSYFTSLLFLHGSKYYLLLDWVSLLIACSFQILFFRKGILSGIFSILGIILIAGIVLGASELIGGGDVRHAGEVLGAVAGAIAGEMLTAITVAMAMAILGNQGGRYVFLILVAAALTVSYAISGNMIPVSIVSIIIIGIGFYLGRQVLKDETRNTFIRRLAFNFASVGGTSFLNADLTDANFSKAELKSTDFRYATLFGVDWKEAELLDQVRCGDSYIQKPKLRQLLISGRGEHDSFDRQDFRHVNLKAAKFANSSFIDTDFYQANLQGADLSRAILVRANFERADLRNADLTGSCIQDWTITESTKLDGIICDYVYLKWINGDKRDQMPPRGKFKPGGFVTFVRYILETVELYHEKDINPRLALNVLHKMSRDYDEPLDIVALGKKGERVFIQLKVSENITRENFKEDYFSRYDTDLKLWSGNIHQLPPAVDSFIEKRISEIASEKTDDFVFVDAIYIEGNYTENNQGEVNMTGDRNIYMGSGNYNERIEGDYVQGNQFNSGQQNLAEAAAEIQELLKQLEETYPTDSTANQMVVAAKAVEKIEGNPTLKQKAISAVKEGGIAAFEKAIDNPAGAFIAGAAKGWQEVK